MIRLNLMRGRIPLTQGQVAKVDEKDWKELSQHSWGAQWNPYTESFYAQRGRGGSSECMHRRIMNLEFGDGLQVDHINHDTLDNRRENLRIVTPRGNQENLRRPSVHGTGVRFDRRQRSRPYEALAQVDGRKQHIGLFATPEEAQAARKVWLQERGLA